MSVTASARGNRAALSAKPYIVVSADTHIGPRLVEDLRPYCPPAHLAQFDEQVQQLDAMRARFSAIRSESPMSFRNMRTEGHYDVHARLRDLDRDGVAAEVIFHGSQNGEGMPFQSFGDFGDDDTDVSLVAVGRHIYNQWLADFVSVEPERHVGLAQLPMWDIDAAVAELEWARAAGLRGVNFPAPRPNMTPYNSPEWDVFWSACESLGVSLCNHGGAGIPRGGIGSVFGASLPGTTSIMKLESATLSRVSPMSHLIYGGVFERHPKLRLVLTELPGAWWPYVMNELDSLYMTDSRIYGPDLARACPRLPSEYAAECVFQGASFMSRFEAEDAISNGYARNVIWGSDYPHVEGTFQYPEDLSIDEAMTRLSLRFTYAGLPAEEMGWMLGGNAIRAYGLDEAALQSVASRIGAPTFEELSVPLEEVPEEGGHYSFRTFGFWA
jgi:predicted TIM-barrel fold metal-dependent hydrolase